MFFLFAVLSMIGYAVQGTFLVKYARRMDGLSLAVYRNLSLAVTMVPLLFFERNLAPLADKTFWLILMGSALAGALSLACRFRAQKSLPVGIDSALNGVTVFLLLLWGYLFFREVLSPLQLLFIVFVLAGVFALTIQDHSMPHLDGRTRRGVFFSMLNNIFGSTALFSMGFLSRSAPPLAVAYFWEVAIGAAAALLVLIRWLRKKEGLQKIAMKDFLKISAISSFTVLGTGALVLAVARGPIGIVSAIGSAGIVVGTVFSHFIYGEKLRWRHWTVIGAVVLGIAGLRLVSG